jgi:DNA-binding FadR family transcriptional regulator
MFRVRPEQFTAVLDQHRRLVAALDAGDAPAYRAVLAEHVAGHGVTS